MLEMRDVYGKPNPLLDPKVVLMAKKKIVTILQFLTRQLCFDDWYEITPDNMNDYIGRLKKCTRDDYKEHCLFLPNTMAPELARLTKGNMVFKNKMDELMHMRNNKEEAEKDRIKNTI